MREQLQLLVSAAAMSAATQLNALSHSVEPFPESPPRDPVTPSVLSLSRVLGGFALGQAEAIVRREVAFGVVPDLERRLLVIANHIPVTTLSAEEAVRRWEGIRLAPDELWVDIGSGNADTLGRLARRNSGGRFVGVEKENSVGLFWELQAGAPFMKGLPENVRYLVLSWNKPGRGPAIHERLEQLSLVGRWADKPSQSDRIAAATVETIGAGAASVVSLIFPYTESQEPRGLVRVFRGPVPRMLDYQLRTAVDLLRPGGWGVAVLESGPLADQKRVMERALHYLRSCPEIGSISLTSQPIDAARLDIAPYAPMDAKGKTVDTQPLTQGRLLFFQRRV